MNLKTVRKLRKLVENIGKNTKLETMREFGKGLKM